MPLTVIPLAINFMIGAGIWMSDCPIELKIIFTTTVVVKYAIFFIAALLIEADIPKRLCLALCAVFNVLLIVFGILEKISIMAMGASTLLFLLIVWSLATVFDIHVKGGKKQ